MHELFRLLLSFCIFVIQPCLAFTLVTSEEAIKEAKNSKDYILKLGENNTLPSIKLVHPNVLSEFITSPLSIELAFKKKGCSDSSRNLSSILWLNAFEYYEKNSEGSYDRQEFPES